MPFAVRFLVSALTCHSLLGAGWAPGLAFLYAQERRPTLANTFRSTDSSDDARALAAAPAPRRIAAPQPPAAAAGEVGLSISIRQTPTGPPKFVMAFRVVEHGEPAAQDFQTPAVMVAYYSAAAQSAIEQLDQLCQLDDKQESKLRLAAMGDMSRLAREARQVHEKFAGISPRNQEMLAVAAELSTINASLSEGVFRSGSMFNRVLASSLTARQTDQVLRERFRAQLDDWSLGLTTDQCQKVVDLMIEHRRRLSEPIVWYKPHEFAALVRSIPGGELEQILEPEQLLNLKRSSAPE